MNELMVGDNTPLRALDVRAQVNLIQEVMRDVMHRDTHYGTVPGCGDKPTLLQPGAHKLLMTFRLVPDPEVTITDMGNGHREVRCKVKLYSQGGVFLGAGVGTCSTMEGKYRFRTGPVEFTDKPVPREYWDLRKTDPVKAKALLGDGMVAKKNDDGVWMCAMQGGKVEHDNPADYYNTVEKMSYKRALVSATLTVTAASDIFTQDIEDMPEVIPGAAQPKPAPAEGSQDKAADVLSKMKSNGNKPEPQSAGQAEQGVTPQASDRAPAPSDDTPAFIWRVGKKHAGESVRTIPDDYLTWFAENGKAADHVQAANDEIDRRMGQASAEYTDGDAA
jgi:hypothetical protein